MRSASVTLDRADAPRRRALPFDRVPFRRHGGRAFLASAVLHAALFGALWNLWAEAIAPAAGPREIAWTPMEALATPAEEVERVVSDDVVAFEPDLRPPEPPPEPVPVEDWVADDSMPDVADAPTVDRSRLIGLFDPRAARVRIARRPAVASGEAIAPAPPAPPPPQPVTVPVRPAVLTRPSPLEGNLSPAFPPEALARGERGDVVVRMWISAEGTVTRVEVDRSSGSDVLDRAAVAAVWAWRFSPAKRDGEPIPAVLRQVIHFR